VFTVVTQLNHSFTGEKLSSTMMDNETLSRPTTEKVRIHDKVDIYLPEAMQVSSIHLLAGTDLAVAHRHNADSTYVLRETGQVIGDENSGIAPLWQGLLGCDERGEAVDQSAFWEGWQQRSVEC
jgi:hypothetical protein